MSSYSKFVLTTSPLLLVLLFIVLYIIFDTAFVRCENDGAKCSPIDGNMISRVANAESQANSNIRLNQLDANVKKLSDQLANTNLELANTQGSVHQKTLMVDNSKVEELYANISNTNSLRANINGSNANFNPINAKTTNVNTLIANINANTKRLAAEKERAENEVKSKQFEANKISQEIGNNENSAVAIRTQYSGRYSSRMIWIFLTAVFTSLCIAALICAWFVIYKSNKIFNNPEETSKKTFRWLVIASVISVILSGFVFYFREQFGSIMLPIFRQSVFAVNELSDVTFIFFIIFGFVGSIFLIMASCAVFVTAVETDEKVPLKTVSVAGTVPPTTIQVEDTAEKLKIYSTLLKHLRTILYVGTFMLFVGILRMSYLMQWHLAFISNSSENPLYKLLDVFSESSMSVQGGFYTILLAAIYLPAAYWIKERASLLGATNDELQAKGIVFSYSDVVFRLLAIVSPLIAGAFSGKWLSFFDTSQVRK